MLKRAEGTSNLNPATSVPKHPPLRPGYVNCLWETKLIDGAFILQSLDGRSWKELWRLEATFCTFYLYV